MIWVALAALAAINVLGALFLVRRIRAALQRQNHALVAQLEQQRAALDELTAALERARVERSKINTRAEKLRGVVTENRAGVQDAKDRSTTLRTQVNGRLTGNGKLLNELRSITSGHGTALNSTRTEVQRLREQVRGLTNVAQSPAVPTDPITTEHADSATLRSAPRIQAALERLAETAIRTTGDDEPHRGVGVDVDLTRLLPQDGGPKVTVVVTCYNDAAYLEDCLRSVREQTLPEFECIVVDDASTDESVSIANTFAMNDARFVVVSHETNSGPSAARNTGMARASSPFICFLDSDDMLLKQSLEQRLYSYLPLTDRAVAGVFSGIEHRPAEVRFDDLPDELAWSAPSRRSLVSTRGECPFNLHAPLLRTDILRRTGGFDETMRVGAEDWELWLRLMRNGYVFEPCHAVLGIYRQKPQSLVRAHPADHLAASSHLLDSVQQAADPSTEISGAPFFFAEPLSYYDQKILLTTRGYQYLSLAALSNDDSQFERALDELPSGLDNIVDHHVNRTAQVLAGLRRGLGLTPEEFATIQPEARLVQTNITRLAQTRKTPPPPIAVPARLARTSPDPLRMFYWQAADGVAGTANFGDELSPLLVALASGRTVERAELDQCHLVALGSVLDLVLAADHRHPAIWGSGFIKEGPSTGAGLDVHAVRGHLTNERCGSVGAIGDPALLARYLKFGDAEPARVGLLPHYVDTENPFCDRFVNEVPDCVLIDPLQPPLDVLAQIAACDVVFSSSLHGLICADSLGVPNAWIELSDKVVGNGYKFTDYYSCFDLSPSPIRPNAPSELESLIGDVIDAHDRPQLDRLCAGLLDAFPSNV